MTFQKHPAMSHRESHVKTGRKGNYDFFINVKCEGLADRREHEPPLGGGSCLMRAATRHNPMAATEARRGVVSHNICLP